MQDQYSSQSSPIIANQGINAGFLGGPQRLESAAIDDDEFQDAVETPAESFTAGNSAYGSDTADSRAYGSSNNAGYGSTNQAGYVSANNGGYSSANNSGYGSAGNTGDGSASQAGYGAADNASYGSSNNAGHGSAGYASSADNSRQPYVNQTGRPKALCPTVHAQQNHSRRVAFC